MKQALHSDDGINYYSGITADRAALNRDSTMSTHGNERTSRASSVHKSKIDFKGSPVNARRKSRHGSSSMFDEDI